MFKIIIILCLIGHVISITAVGYAHSSRAGAAQATSVGGGLGTAFGLAFKKIESALEKVGKPKAPPSKPQAPKQPPPNPPAPNQPPPNPPAPKQTPPKPPAPKQQPPLPPAPKQSAPVPKQPARQSSLQKRKGPYKPGTAVKNNQGVIRKVGPSGREMIHTPRYNSRKAGYEAAKLGSKNIRGKSTKVIKDQAHGKVRLQNRKANEQQRKDHFNKNKKGDKSRHYHSTYSKDKNKKLDDGVHHLTPKRR